MAEDTKKRILETALSRRSWNEHIDRFIARVEKEYKKP